MERLPSLRLLPCALALAVLGFAGCGMTLTPPGFVREHRHAVCRGWFDFNSYRRPSLTFERYDRLPPDSRRVKMFRWTHAGSVEAVPVVSATQSVEIAPSSPKGGASSGAFQESPDSDGKGPAIDIPPPAPPSDREPIFPNEFIPPAVPPEQVDQDELIADSSGGLSGRPASAGGLSTEAIERPSLITLDFSVIDEEPLDLTLPAISDPKPTCNMPEIRIP